MRLAAVILNYNDAKESIEAVRRIKDYKAVDAVVVVDNASTDDSVKCIEEYLSGLGDSGRFILLRSPGNGGYGAGNNLGVRYAYEALGAKYVLISNPDASFSEETAEKMLEAFSREKDAAVVSAKMTDGTGGVQQTAWSVRSWLLELINSGPVSRRIFRSLINYSEDYFKGRTSCEVGAVHGSLLCVDADKFVRAGGYDENIFLYCEENVIGFKLREAGYKTILLLNASYSHAGSESIKKSLKGMVKRQKIRQRSERYYYKHYLKAGPFKMLFTYIFQTVVLAETFIAERLGKI